ncbi:MAG: hypothetical protein H7210_09575 [Pyrinomonadaceae bacterium]|nr:hypothetical protein [Phycisphaerales bacterium]
MLFISRRTGLSTLCASGIVWASTLAAPVAAQTPTPTAPAAPAAAQPSDGADLVTKDDVIAGTMDIDFITRTKLDSSGDLKKGSAALGAKDQYKFSLRVAETTDFTGVITRQPNLYSSVLARKKQDASLSFKIDLSVLNPRDLKQKKTVGNWVGEVPIDTKTGAFQFDGAAGSETPPRIFIDAVGSAKSFTDKFSGRLIGKAESKEGLASYTYTRLVGTKKVNIVVKKSDPMRFENLTLAKGPSENYPRTIVNGRLDYDYETGNWFTDGVKLRYNLNGKEVEDVITGSIKWVEDKDRASNGKGYYEFNLRFNEDKNKAATTEAAAFDKMSEEDAFFAVDNSVPCLTGRIAYVDTMVSGGEGDPTVTASKVSYNLNANKLTKQQIMNFFKLWIVSVGPTNDE